MPGLEKLHLKRTDKSDSYMILFKNSAYVWMNEVISERPSKAHVNTEAVYGCEIRDSYFNDATNYKGGGEGYGVQLGLHTTNCLIENNIFRRLRHAMLVDRGANGNVFTYNYARENFQDSRLASGHHQISHCMDTTPMPICSTRTLCSK